MNKKLSFFLSFLFLLTIALFSEYYVVKKYFCSSDENRLEKIEEEQENIPQGMMILIEYTDMVGLSNFVNEMYQRDITGLFYTGPEFVEENCEDIKKLLEYDNIEIMASYTKDPLWGLSYEEQYEGLKNSKDRIEACTGEPVRILSSKYQASDENTAKVADALGVPYIVARGTTETEAFVYQPEEYDVKILSVSNIPSIRFKYGSLCDYSYWVRGGAPDDMMVELTDALQNEKITLLSHTKIGGIKERWLDMWTEYWDSNEIEWVSLDEIMTVDMTLPYWQIPQNHNNPYTPSTMKPDFELSQEEDVLNPCAVDELPFVESQAVVEDAEESVVIFSNGTGPMCLEAEDFMSNNNVDYTLYLTSDSDFQEKLGEHRQGFNVTEGLSGNWEYYPYVFVNGHVFSGFNDEIGQEILDLL